MTTQGSEAEQRYQVDVKCGLATVVELMVVVFPHGRRCGLSTQVVE